MTKVSMMYSNSDEDFKKLVANSYTITEVCKNLGYRNVHGNTGKLFRKRCEELNIDYSHFNPYKSRGRIVRTEENVFCLDSTADQETTRRWYKKGNYSPYICSICGIDH